MRGTPYVHGDFRGGLNTKAADYLLEDSQCRDSLNVQSTTAGAIVKRQGVAEVFDAGAALKTIYLSESTGADLFITATDTSLQARTMTGSAVGSAVTGLANGTWSVVEATAQDGEGPVFLMNGTDTPRSFNGSTFGTWTADGSSTTTLPNGKYLLIHESRVLVAGTTTEPSTLYWSEVQVGVGTLPRRWMIENQQLFDPNDGDEITGIGKAGSNVLVFKRHKVFVVYDLNTGASRRLTTNIGCIAPKSIVETPVGTMFLSDNGVYVTNGSSVDLVSDQITPTIRAIGSSPDATADYYRNHYYLSFPQGNVILDFDLSLKSWWKHKIASGVSDFAGRFNNGSEEMYCSSGTKVGQMFVGYQDFGSNYEWYWKGPWLAPGQARVVYPAVRKRMRAIRIDGSGTCTLKVGKDFSTAENTVTPQNQNGTPRTALFPEATSTTFGSTYTNFGDYYTTPNPPANYVSPTTFGDIQSPQQSRVWGQGVARSWSLVFGDSTPTSSAATIQNYTIFMQERNQ